MEMQSVFFSIEDLKKHVYFHSIMKYHKMTSKTLEILQQFYNRMYIVTLNC